MDALIIGNGSAGQRLGKLLNDLDVKTHYYDSDPEKSDFTELGLAINAKKDGYHFVVVASPPDLHEYHMIAAARAAPYILVEKPIVGFRKSFLGPHILSDFIDPVKLYLKTMVAYNYKYHPLVLQLVRDDDIESVDMYCEQTRKRFPPWGILLDHVSHDIDIARTIMPSLRTNNIKEMSVGHDSNRDFEKWEVSIETSNNRHFNLFEKVWKTKDVERKADIVINNDAVPYELSANSIMYLHMVMDFVSAVSNGSNIKSIHGYADALLTQEFLNLIRGKK